MCWHQSPAPSTHGEGPSSGCITEHVRAPRCKLSTFKEEPRDPANLPFRIISQASWLGEIQRESLHAH